ncbi:MAG: hypothetical protein ACLR8Y_02390 [Alistipes indistinctus]
MQRIELSSLKISQIMAGPYFSYPVTNRWLLGTKLLVGYYHMRRSEINAVVGQSNDQQTASAPGDAALRRMSRMAILCRGMRSGLGDVVVIWTLKPPLPNRRRRPENCGCRWWPSVKPAISVSVPACRSLIWLNVILGVRIFYDCNFSPANLAVTTYNADGASKQTNVKHFSTSSTLGIAVNIVFW